MQYKDVGINKQAVKRSYCIYIQPKYRTNCLTYPEQNKRIRTKSYAHNAAILERSEREAYLIQDGDHAWAQFKSIKASRKMMLPINNGKKRKDGAPECTHSLEVVDRHYNETSPEVLHNWIELVREAYGDEKRTEHQLIQEAREAIAFMDYHHDTIEDNRWITIDTILDNCWKGHPNLRPHIKRILALATDTEGLTKQETEDEQIYRANVLDKTGYLKEMRLHDKESARHRDNENILKGIIPHKGNLQKAYNYLDRKSAYIQRLDLPKHRIKVSLKKYEITRQNLFNLEASLLSIPVSLINGQKHIAYTPN